MNSNSVKLFDVVAASAIVGVVAAVVIPALASAQTDSNSVKIEKAKAHVCQSNMKQLCLGLIMYTEDYDETCPSGANWAGSGSGWAQQIYPYVKSFAIFKCPKDDSDGVSSYAYNSNLVRLTGPKFSPPKGLLLADMSGPSRTVALFEVSGNHGPMMQDYKLFADIHSTGNTEAPFDGYSPAGNGLGLGAGDLNGMGANPPHGSPTLKYATGYMINMSTDKSHVGDPRHLGKSNIGYCDGHVASVYPAEVSAGLNNPVDNSPGGSRMAANTSVTYSGPLTTTFSVY